MLWNKIVFSLLFAISTILICSCHVNNSIRVTPVIDSTKINYWKKAYDSLYDKYGASRDPMFLQQGGIFADSVLLYEPQLLKDTSKQQVFFDVLFNRALDLNDLGYYVKSRELLDKYTILYPRYTRAKKEMLAYAQKTLANIYSRYGDYKKAVLLLQQGLEYNTSLKNNEEIASCMNNLSIPLKELRRYDEAEKILQEVFQLVPVSQKRKAKASIELADIYVRQKKIADAGIQIQQAKKFLLVTPYDLGITETYAQLYSIEGNWQLANDHPKEALKAYRRSVDSAKISSGQNPRNREQGKTYIAMGKAMEQLHFSDSALYYYNMALYTVTAIDTLDKFSLPKPNGLYPENTIAEALYARADCIIARGMENIQELQNAASCYKLAFETERKLLNAVSYDESRFHMVGETRKQTEKAIGVCYQLYQKTNNKYWVDEAFLFAENNKAFVLAESVRRNIAASLFLQKDTLYQKTQALQANLALIEIELGKQNFSIQPDSALMLTLSNAKQTIEEELLSFENNIRINNPLYDRRITGEDSLTAKEIINKIVSSGTSVIEYFTGDSCMYLFSGDKNKQLDFFKLQDTIKNLSADFLQFFSTRNLILNDPQGYAAVANTLYRYILNPYLPKGDASLLIIPDGFISYIPFDALLTMGATSGNIGSFPFLIKQKETYYTFSCKTLLMQMQHENNDIDNSIAAFAPIFPHKERGISPLLHSNEELEAIKQFYPQGKFYSGNKATLKQFEEDCAGSGIIHLATHAYPGSDSVSAAVEFYDSTLYLNRIYAMPLKAKLVVLSGCETGTGAINKTEGVMSLARGFSYAGTKNVIASLWQTEDNISADIFKNFYSNLATNNFSSALRKAKLSVINNSSVASASPYYWAGFIYIGSPTEKLNSGAGSKLNLILLIACFLLIVVYFFFRKRKLS